MGELSCESDCQEDRSGLRMSNVALKKKAKKLSLQNQKELEIMSRECTPQVQVKRVELHRKNIRSQDVTHSAHLNFNSSKDGNTPRPFQDFSNDIKIHQLEAGIYKTQIKDKRKSPPLDSSDFDENEKPKGVELTQPPRVAEYSVGRDSSRSTHSSASQTTQPTYKRGEQGRGSTYQMRTNVANYGSATSRGSRPTIKDGSYLNSFQLKQKREEEFRNVINKLKDKKPVFNLAKEAFLASSKKIISAKIVPPKRFKNYSFSGSVSTHSQTMSASTQDVRVETPSDSGEDRSWVKGAVCLTESTPKDSTSPASGKQQETLLDKLESKERQNDNLRLKLSKIQKENEKLKIQRDRQDRELTKREITQKEINELVSEIERESKEKSLQIKKLREKLEIQNNLVRDLRQKLEVMIQRATSQQERNEGWSRQGIMREMESLKKELRQRVEEKKKEIQTSKILHNQIQESEAKILLLEKENIEYRGKLDEILFNYQTIEEELAEERAQHRETKMLKEQRNHKRLKFQEFQVKQKIYEIQNLKNVINDDMSLLGGQFYQYQKEIQKQLSQIRIEHQLQKEKQREIERYTSGVESDLLEAKMALGRYKDDNERFQKHIDKLGGELESSKQYCSSLEIDVFRSRQELAESVNVIGDYEKENIELQNRLNKCYEKLGVS